MTNNGLVPFMELYTKIYVCLCKVKRPELVAFPMQCSDLSYSHAVADITLPQAIHLSAKA